MPTMRLLSNVNIFFALFPSAASNYQIILGSFNLSEIVGLDVEIVHELLFTGIEENDFSVHT